MIGSGVLRSEPGVDLARQLHALRAVVFATYVPPLCALAALAALSLATGIEASYLTRDPSETLRAPFYIGFVSNVGILVWSAAAAVCLFAAAVLARTPGAVEQTAFLLASGFLTSWLALDDLFTLHDVVIPTYLFVPQKLFLAVLGLVVFSYLVRFRVAILATDYLLLLLAFGFLALSVLFDGLQGRFAVPFHHYFEDGTKLLGIVGWAVYLTRTAAQQVLSIARR